MSHIDNLSAYVRDHVPRKYRERVFDGLLDVATGAAVGNPHEIAVLIALGIWSAEDPYRDRIRPTFGEFLNSEGVYHATV